MVVNLIEIRKAADHHPLAIQKRIMFTELSIDVSFTDWFSFFIQDYYKSGMIRCPPSVTVRELREACDYLLIPFDANTVKCQNLRKWILSNLPQCT